MGMIVKVDWQHIAITVGSAFAGAAVGYLEQQNPVALIASFSSWQTARPLVFGFVAAGIGAVLALAKKSFIAKGPDAPPPMPGATEFLPRSVPPPPETEGVVLTFPKPPKPMTYGALLLLGACTPASGQPGPTDIALYERDQLMCVDQADSRAEADQCRRSDHAVWCSRWPDAINCPKDAGGQ